VFAAQFPKAEAHVLAAHVAQTVSVFASAFPTVVRATAAPQTCASWLPQVEWVAQSPLPAAQVPAAQLLQVLSPVAVPSVATAVVE